jgi:hypothetical protein
VLFNNPPVELVFESGMDGYKSCRRFDVGISSGLLVLIVSHMREV